MNVAGLTLDQIIEALAVEQRDHLAALEARLAALTEERDRLKVMVEDYDIALGKAQARLAVLTAALAQYGKHDEDCWDRSVVQHYDVKGCACGFDAALDAAGGA